MKKRALFPFTLALIFSSHAIPLAASAPTMLLPSIAPLADAVTLKRADVQEASSFDLVQINGYVGNRISGNVYARLINVDTDRLLEGYRKRPGRQTWDGEHVGKWLHAATLAWVGTGDPTLKEKLRHTAYELMKCQLDDGYLGTYEPSKRWTEWDVWAHKYNLIGLLTYMRYTGDVGPLECCKRMADLIIKDFGEGPGQRDIITEGGAQHIGMATTSILEPMILLYRFTGDQRYLEFSRYILRAWENPNGPQIISRLLAGNGVDKVGNGKAYEMLSCLNGVLELYRTTGDDALLKAAKMAWADIVEKRLYITGSASFGELFHGDHVLERARKTMETCVTVTWLQFNAQLLRLTGDVRFADQLELTLLNQLLGAQKPDCRKWSYYVNLEGRKAYTESLDGQCCLSSGPRGIAQIPAFAIAKDGDGVVLNLIGQMDASVPLSAAGLVSIRVDSDYPAKGSAVISVSPERSATFSVKIRKPQFADSFAMSINGVKTAVHQGADGYYPVTREWKAGDRLELEYPLAPRMILGSHGDAGRVAITYGPLVLALDEGSICDMGQTVMTVRLAGSTPDMVHLVSEMARADGHYSVSRLVIEADVIVGRRGPGVKPGDKIRARFVPFSEASGDGSHYRVWIPSADLSEENLLLSGAPIGHESASELEYLNDDNTAYSSWVMKTDGTQELWFGVKLEAPETFSKFVVYNGTGKFDSNWQYTFPGWFDSSRGKPRIEVQAESGAPWKTVAFIDSYPETTAGVWPKFPDDGFHMVVLSQPVTASAVRVIGMASHNADVNHAELTIGEIQGFAKPE